MGILAKYCTRVYREERDSEKVTVRSEISTWRAVLAVTFGILCDENFFGILNPSVGVQILISNVGVRSNAWNTIINHFSWKRRYGSNIIRLVTVHFITRCRFGFPRQVCENPKLNSVQESCTVSM